MRQIVLDTETTGLDPKSGHRIIEIACLEMVNRKITGNHLHVYVNPERDIERDATAVHGITTEFLKDKALFKEISQEFLDYVKDAELIIHNAPFDVGFINMELERVHKKLGKIENHCKITDSLKIARQLHMGQRNSLDALCKRYGVDNSHREFHGALLDAELLAKVYLLMTGGQVTLFGEELEHQVEKQQQDVAVHIRAAHGNLRVVYADERELAAHAEKLKSMKMEETSW